MTIPTWPEYERPREKLLRLGSRALSDAELLAVFLRVGVAGCSAVDLARSLLQRFGGLNAVLDASVDDLVKINGLGKAKVAQLYAALALGERYLEEKVYFRQYLNSSEEVKKLLTARMRKYKNECFDAIFLSAQHHILAIETLFTGSVQESTVYPRTIVTRCLHHNAAALVVAHNHPSGRAQPSAADELLTRQLRSLLAELDITLIDHIIIGDQPFSFAEHGLC